MKDEPFESEPNETEETKLMLKVDQNFLDPLEDSDEEQGDRNRYTLVDCRTYKNTCVFFQKFSLSRFWGVRLWFNNTHHCAWPESSSNSWKGLKGVHSSDLCDEYFSQSSFDSEMYT